MSAITYPLDNTLVIGELSHYHFYQPINHVPHQSTKYQKKRNIIPSVPRQHRKAPVNSSLSFIRQQKLPRHINSFATPSSSSANLLSPLPSSSIGTPTTDSTTSTPQQRPPMFAQSTADLLNNLATLPTKQRPSLDSGRRPRKVSFNENVMVICTRFDGDEEDDKDVDGDSMDIGQTDHPKLVYQGRRHSTGEHIMVDRRRKSWLSFVELLNPWPSTSSTT